VIFSLLPVQNTTKYPKNLRFYGAQVTPNLKIQKLCFEGS